jgi:hypothetical protein
MGLGEIAGPGGQALRRRHLSSASALRCTMLPLLLAHLSQFTSPQQ